MICTRQGKPGDDGHLNSLENTKLHDFTRSANTIPGAVMLAHTSRGRLVRRLEYMLVCTRLRFGSVPSTSSSTWSVYTHTPPRVAPCKGGAHTVVQHASTDALRTVAAG